MDIQQTLTFEKISQNLAAEQRMRLNIAGEFFRLGESEYPVSVSLFKDGRVLGVMSNQLAGDYVRDISFDGVEIINGNTQQTITVQIASGGAGSDRVLGEVSVISGEVSRSKAGNAFWGGRGYGQLAGAFSYMQLWNPSGSGKRAIVEEIIVSDGLAGTGYVVIRDSVAQLAVLMQQGANKKLGGAASVIQVRAENNAAALGGGIMSVVDCGQRAVALSMREPAIIEPGYGIIVSSGGVNEAVRAQFQWFEEDI